MTPPLKRYMPALTNFILDFSGETSMGKTTALRLAASVWGSPDERGGGIVYAWDVSRVFVERTAAMLDYLPMFLDDTKRARRSEDVGKTLYDYASGVGRGRGSLQGLQRVTRAHGVLLSTGEAPATSFTNDGGTRARALCLWGSPFEGTNRATEAAVSKVQRMVLDNYGHAGPRLVRYLLDHPEARAGLSAELARNLESWTQLANGHPRRGLCPLLRVAACPIRGGRHRLQRQYPRAIGATSRRRRADQQRLPVGDRGARADLPAEQRGDHLAHYARRGADRRRGHPGGAESALSTSDSNNAPQFDQHREFGYRMIWE